MNIISCLKAPRCFKYSDRLSISIDQILLDYELLFGSNIKQVHFFLGFNVACSLLQFFWSKEFFHKYSNISQSKHTLGSYSKLFFLINNWCFIINPNKHIC